MATKPISNKVFKNTPNDKIHLKKNVVHAYRIVIKCIFWKNNWIFVYVMITQVKECSTIHKLQLHYNAILEPMQRQHKMSRWLYQTAEHNKI